MFKFLTRGMSHRHVQNSSLTPIDFQLSSFPSSSVLMSGVHFGCTAILHVERLEAISVLNKTEPYIALFTQSVSVVRLNTICRGLSSPLLLASGRVGPCAHHQLVSYAPSVGVA